MFVHLICIILHDQDNMAHCIFRQDMPESLPMEIAQTITEITERRKNSLIKDTGNSCWHFSNSYTLTDDYYHCLTSGVT